MLNLNKIKGHLTNGKQVLITKKYIENGQLFEIFIGFNLYEKKIILEIHDYDFEIKKYDDYWELPCKRQEVKKFDTLEETTDYIFKTTILKEDDFPHKFKQKEVK